MQSTLPPHPHANDDAGAKELLKLLWKNQELFLELKLLKWKLWEKKKDTTAFKK